MGDETVGNLPHHSTEIQNAPRQLFDCHAYLLNGVLWQDMRGHHIRRQVDAGIEIHADSVGLSGLTAGKQVVAGLPSGASASRLDAKRPA